MEFWFFFSNLYLSLTISSILHFFPRHSTFLAPFLFHCSLLTSAAVATVALLTGCGKAFISPVAGLYSLGTPTGMLASPSGVFCVQSITAALKLRTEDLLIITAWSYRFRALTSLSFLHSKFHGLINAWGFSFISSSFCCKSPRDRPCLFRVRHANIPMLVCEQ